MAIPNYARTRNIKHWRRQKKYKIAVNISNKMKAEWKPAEKDQERNSEKGRMVVENQKLVSWGLVDIDYQHKDMATHCEAGKKKISTQSKT